MVELRVLSYNIHKGFSTGNRKFILRQIKEAIRLVRADLVFLQEVLGEHEDHAESISDWPDMSQFEFLADEVWSHFAYGKNAVYSSGHHGNAILSKYPIVKWENEDVSTNARESRGLLHTVIHIPDIDTHVDCVCVHLDLFQQGRTIQVDRLCERMKRETNSASPLIIAGDFNDWRQKSTSPILEKAHCQEAFQTFKGAHARTFPSSLPLLKLDRIYFRGMEVLDAQALTGAPWSTLSDHAALFADFAIAAYTSPARSSV